MQEEQDKVIKEDPLNSPTLKSSVRDGMSHAVMLGSGETYLAPFAIFLKGSNFQIGLLAALPLLIGSLSQFFGVWLTEKFSSRLKIIKFFAAFQALTWVPIALVPYIWGFQPASVTVLICLAVLYQTAGSIILPAWNSLIGEIVPVETRGRFFGYRNRQVGLMTFVSMIMAGKTLHLFDKGETTAYCYTLIFLIAMCARLMSLKFLSRYPDPAYHVKQEERFTFKQFLLNSPKSNFARFVFFFACMNFAAYIAGPYFGMYLLNDLKISYSEYTLIIASITISQFLAMNYWGKLTDQFGNKMILNFCSCGVALVPFAWLLTANIYWIMLIQVVSGFVWAGFNLSAANFIFDAVTPPKRARCVAYQAVVNSSFIFTGSIIGASLAALLPAVKYSDLGMNLPDSVYPMIFTISGFIRLVILILLLRTFKEVRDVGNLKHRDLIFRITSLKPLSGISFGLITGKIIKKKQE